LFPFHEAINDAPIGALIGAEQTQKGADSILTDGHQETESYTPASQLPSIVAGSAVTIGLTRELYIIVMVVRRTPRSPNPVPPCPWLRTFRWDTRGKKPRAFMGIIRNRHGVYEARKKVPKRLEEATATVLGVPKRRQSWLKKSLGTKDLREAKIRAKPVLMEFDRTV
jgi:hypothetical protein